MTRCCTDWLTEAGHGSAIGQTLTCPKCGQRWRLEDDGTSYGSWEIERVKGGDLKVGDRVLIECEVAEINQYGHAIARPVRESHWHVGDQQLWTWGGEHGAGINVPPSIRRL